MHYNLSRVCDPRVDYLSRASSLFAEIHREAEMSRRVTVSLCTFTYAELLRDFLRIALCRREGSKRHAVSYHVTNAPA